MKRSTFQTKKQRLMEERARKKLCLDKEIQEMKEEIIQMKIEFSEKKYRYPSIHKTINQKGNKNREQYRHARQYSEGS